MASLVAGPNHRPANPIWSVRDCLVRNVNSLTVNAHASMTVFAFPIRIVDAPSIAAIAAVHLNDMIIITHT